MINVILADHERIFRIGMASALAAEDDIRIVGQPQSIDQLLHGLENFRPHVVVLSSAFLSRIDAVRQICDRQRTAILLLEDGEEVVFPQSTPNVHGVMRRSADEATVVRCIRQLAQGRRLLRVMGDIGSETTPDLVGIRVRQQLTRHELRVIALVVQGFRNREIASQTGMAEHSVKNSLRRIFDKTGVFDRLELALFVVHHRALRWAAAEAKPTPNMKSLAIAQPEWRISGRTNVH